MSFLLESVKGPPTTARYSFIGFEPYLEFTLKNGLLKIAHPASSSGIGASSPYVRDRTKPLAVLEELTGGYRQLHDNRLPPFQGGAVGLLSYDFVHYLEKLPVTTADDLGIYDAHFLMTDRLIAFDHSQGKAWIIVCPGARKNLNDDLHVIYDEAAHELRRLKDFLKQHRNIKTKGNSSGKIEIIHDTTEEEYSNMVRRTKDYISAGDIFQANLSLRVSASIGDIMPWEIYKILRSVNPSPFAAFMDFGEYTITSSSPERLVKVSNGIVETRPIAGTRPRGRDKTEDDRMRKDLLLNDKERAEHIMLIDLERNDIGRVCDYGTIEVDEFMTTEDYSHVIHIVSNIKGRLAGTKTLMDTIKAVFPGGTITGVPKVRCMEIIDEIETLRRGPYTGSIGYIGFSGCMDLNIIIRTFTTKNGMAYVQAGAGIVADSDPSREYQESLKKAEALIRTLELVGT
jgi:anthranilate/para-aminobenzoate synthase component I